jgi:hypothetical protein
MNFRVFTGYAPCTLKVTLSSLTGSPVNIRLLAFDESQANTFFTDRFNQFQGQQTLYIRMPLSPKVSIVQVYDTSQGNLSQGNTQTFSVQGIEKMGLDRRMDVTDISNPDIGSFVVFCQKFCYNAGVLDAPMRYFSGDKKYFINYTGIITGKNGKELATPARISKKTGDIDVSQKLFVPMTVPGRIAVLLHEFSHLHLNKNMYNEKEADMNALLIYLGLGYPRIDACEVFLKTFYNAATDANWDRYKAIERFINEFEELNFVIN